VVDMRNNGEIADKSGVYGYRGQYLILTGVAGGLRFFGPGFWTNCSVKTKSKLGKQESTLCVIWSEHE